LSSIFPLNQDSKDRGALQLLFEIKAPEQEGAERIAELERLIGQLTVENEALKKASRWLSRASRSGETS
jgi:hypothetical protein